MKVKIDKQEIVTEYEKHANNKLEDIGLNTKSSTKPDEDMLRISKEVDKFDGTITEYESGEAPTADVPAYVEER